MRGIPVVYGRAALAEPIWWSGKKTKKTKKAKKK